jgi:glycolate oxidase FAD binding subunit
LYLRLAGAAGAVAAAGSALGGEQIDEAFWTTLRDQRLDIFTAPDERPLWRVSVRPTSDALLDEDTLVIDWGGAQRFVRATAELSEMSEIARRAGGYAMRMTTSGGNSEFIQQPNRDLRALHERLKQAFDPARILNRGRLYGWL